MYPPFSGKKFKPNRVPFLLATCSETGFLPGLFFYPEDGEGMFLRNVG
jgi:hypothetical protein